MGLDRFIAWSEAPEWGLPTVERLAAVARDFLGSGWKVTIETGGPWITCTCTADGRQTFALRSERRDPSVGDPTVTFGESMHRHMGQHARCIEVFHPPISARGPRTSVITRQADEFTCALADRLASIYARWWNGKVIES